MATELKTEGIEALSPREVAAECWRDPRVSDRVMDAELAEVFAEKITLERARPVAPSSLAKQIDRLADFILKEVPGEPKENEGAIDTAIRLLRLMVQHQESKKEKVMDRPAL